MSTNQPTTNNVLYFFRYFPEILHVPKQPLFKYVQVIEL